jgi:hypothetical protein
MTGQVRFSTMRRVNRKTAAWCSGLLIIVQMVMGPVAHPMSGFAGAADCEHAATSNTPQLAGDCGDCPPAPGQSPGGSPQDHSGTHGHYKCTCPCGHTPALATVAFAALKPVPPADVASEPKGPTFSPPLFDFLRPPN